MNSQPHQANDAPPIDWDKYHTEKLKLKKTKTGEKEMSRKDFERDCALLEDAGWIMTEIQPFAKYARYVKNGTVKEIGKKK